MEATAKQSKPWKRKQRGPYSVKAADTEAIDPRLFYPYPEFIRVSGCSRARICEARRLGVELRTHKVGRRLYVEGADGINFLKQLAAAQEERELEADE
jgi:hypothetical protein